MRLDIAVRKVGRGLISRAEEMVGGPARARVVLVLAAALALPGADFATLSATAGNLEQAFHVNNTSIGAADRLLGRGYLNARVLVPAIALLTITVFLAPGIATTSLFVALPLLTAGAALLGAANPPLDAARLDIIHPALWGRAEGVRTLLRTLGEAAAPALFGLTSETIFGGGDHGLEYTFLVFLVTPIAAGVLALTALRTYPRDVATAVESHRRQTTTASK